MISTRLLLPLPASSPRRHFCLLPVPRLVFAGGFPRGAAVAAAASSLYSGAADWLGGMTRFGLFFFSSNDVELWLIGWVIHRGSDEVHGWR